MVSPKESYSQSPFDSIPEAVYKNEDNGLKYEKKKCKDEQEARTVIFNKNNKDINIIAFWPHDSGDVKLANVILQHGAGLDKTYLNQDAKILVLRGADEKAITEFLKLRKARSF